MVRKNYDDTVTLEIKSETVQLGDSASSRVWVAPLTS
jgi:hypothetical protein